jgi:hypothetical protein
MKIINRINMSDEITNNIKIIKRLDVIIGLLFDLKSAFLNLNKLSNTDGANVVRLKQLGLTNQEIALIFGRAVDKITKLAYAGKKSKKLNANKPDKGNDTPNRSYR